MNLHAVLIALALGPVPVETGPEVDGNPPPAQTAPEAEEGGAAPRDWVFMPAIELGVLAHVDPSIDLAAVFRTSVEYRFRRLRAPFVRLTYDTASPKITQIYEASGRRLTANFGLHDVYFGGGYRWGTERVQGVAGGHLGVQITEVPGLVVDEENALVVDTRTLATGLGVVHAGLEIYFARSVALTFDASARARFQRLRGASVFGFAMTVGVVTAF